MTIGADFLSIVFSQEYMDGSIRSEVINGTKPHFSKQHYYIAMRDLEQAERKYATIGEASLFIAGHRHIFVNGGSTHKTGMTEQTGEVRTFSRLRKDNRHNLKFGAICVFIHC
jgi:hypothetical protein